jgi:hypothetical protein
MGKPSHTVTALCLTGVGAAVLAALGNQWAGNKTFVKVQHEASSLVAADASTGDQFGRSVALFDGLALIGSPIDANPQSAAGSAHLTKVPGTTDDMKKLSAGDASAMAAFGGAVALTKTTALIGADADAERGEDAGAAYVFQATDDDSWKQTAKLTPQGAAANDHFGRSLALDGNVAIVGAPDKASGAAYVFELDDDGLWSEIVKLSLADNRAAKFFGASVAIAGQTAFVGAPGDGAMGTTSGSVYVFQRSTGNWRQTAMLTATDASAFSLFGCSLAISGNTLVIGACADIAAQANSGAAFVFHCDDAGAWQRIAKLVPSDAAPGQRFGHSVALDGDNVVIGSPFANGAAGAAYLFNVAPDGSWKQVAQYTASDATVLGRFGESVAISGHTVLVGAIQSEAAALNTGSAYIFHFDDLR